MLNYKYPSQHSWTSDRTQKQALAKAAWVTFSLADMLASVYSYRGVMVKSISSYCMHGRRVISNPVKYSAIQK